MNSAANDNNTAAATIASVAVFSLGRSGRRVAANRGVSFGVELTWSNGAVTALEARFPAYLAAVTHAARAYRVGERAGMVA